MQARRVATRPRSGISVLELPGRDARVDLRLRRLPYIGREVESGTTMAPEARLAESLRGYGIGGYYR